MNNILLRGGQACGVLGLLMVVASVVLRLSDKYFIGGFQSGSLLLAGIAAIGTGCFALLWLLAERAKT
jgi:hypothetical protein